jgi:hypothetical protein
MMVRSESGDRKVDKKENPATEIAEGHITIS